jgi:hypothetical protein
MIAVLSISAGLILLTKYLDCITTLQRISSPYQERNRLALAMMLRWGIKSVIWGVMGLAVVIVAVTLYLLLTVFTEPVFKVLFAVWAGIISLFQAAVAHSNYSGRANILTSFIRKFSLYQG